MADSVKILKKLISFPTTKEKYDNRIKEYILSLLEGVVADKKVISVSGTQKRSFIIRLGAKKKRERPLVFLCHLDTIIPSAEWKTNPWHPILKDGRIIGLGASDMKGAIASILGAVLKINKDIKDSYLVFTSDEETTVSDIKKVKKSLEFKKSLLIAPESTKGNIKVGQKGVLEIEIAAFGKSLHASKALKKENQKNSAIYKMIGIMEFIKKQETEFNRRLDPDYGVSLVNFGEIKGGTAVNVMPRSCDLGLSYRLIPSDSTDVLYQLIKKDIKKIDNRAKIRILLNGRSFDSRANKATLYKLKSIIEKDIKNIRLIYSQGGWSEIAEFNQNDNELFIIGPGITEQAHQANEFIEVDKIEKFVSIYGSLLKDSSL